MVDDFFHAACAPLIEGNTRFIEADLRSGERAREPTAGSCGVRRGDQPEPELLAGEGSTILMGGKRERL
jgi:hypothetical protein